MPTLCSRTTVTYVQFLRVCMPLDSKRGVELPEAAHSEHHMGIWRTLLHPMQEGSVSFLLHGRCFSLLTACCDRTVRWLDDHPHANRLSQHLTELRPLLSRVWGLK